MCGISAIISFEESDIASNIFNMTRLISHRGPDDEGYAIFGGNPSDIKVYGGDDTPQSVYGAGLNYTPTQGHPVEMHGKLTLGHRRLSIIDLSAKGHQPMSYKNGRYWIVYNGEIYNYIEIRAELVNKGHCFVSGTDTEVILAAYDEWGEGCLDRFNGMWAFVIYDTMGNKVFAARDRFGVKPLFYWKIPGLDCFAIASEIKQFTVFNEWKPKINEPRLYDFLSMGIRNHHSETTFRDVFELRGGEKLLFDFKGKKHEILVWYMLEDKLSDLNIDFDTASRQFRDLFTDSVRLRLRSDVKVGSCLSGGLDSSSIVCTANFLLREKNSETFQETVSSCFKDKKYDEEEYFSEVLKKYNIINHKVYPDSQELFDKLDKLTWYHDEPIPTTGMFAQWKVFEEAKKHNIPVMLDGQGGDELLAGYHLYYDAYFWELLSGFKMKTLFQEMSSYRDMHKYGRVDCGKFIAKMLLGKRAQDLLKTISKRNQSGWFNWKCEKNRIDYLRNSIKDMSISHLKSTSIPRLLHFEDRNSMAHSVESRVPFLDYRLVEFSLSLPSSFKINRGSTKYILRKSMRGLVPDRILNRYDKMGFVTSESDWIKNNSQMFRDVLLKSADLFSNFIDGKQIIKRWDKDILKDNIGVGSFYWRLVSAGIWFKKFRVSLNNR
jgi:asparagine synthase (glutamine-hydrolysing)